MGYAYATLAEGHGHGCPERISVPIHEDVADGVADVDVDPDTGAGVAATGGAGGVNRLFSAPLFHRRNPPTATPPNNIKGT